MADFTERRGNIFTSTAEVVVITVNCEGVMGAGIALDAKLRWPEMFEAYREACRAAEIRPGVLWWWTDPATGRRLLCFPTKVAWRHPSRLEWIRQGLDRLAATYGDEGVASIAMPRLGSSHGRLSWSVVKPLVLERLAACESLRIELWEFDPRAPDPAFQDLVDLLAEGPARAAREVGLTPRQLAAVERAVRSPNVTSLAALANADGVGEKTLVKLYDYIFRRPPGSQPELF